MIKDENNSELINEMLFELQQFLHQEVSIIDNELTRTESLMRDAVTSMSNKFKSIQMLIDEQQGIINNLLDSSAPLNTNEEGGFLKKFVYLSNLTNTLSETLPKINESVSLGICSLQFEDLTNQSLQSIKENIKRIEQVSEKLVCSENYSESCFNPRVIEIRDKCQELYKRTKKAEINRSVKQESMNEGDIDLF